MKTKLFVADGNWYLHRCYFTINPKHREVKDALVYSFISLICKDAATLGCNHMLVAFDGPEIFRYKLYPQYKANRSENTEGASIREGFKEVYYYLPYVLQTLSEVGITWIQPRVFEADDVLCSSASYYSSSTDHVYCGTKDKDAYQYLNEHTSLYDSSFKVKGEPRPREVTYKDVPRLKGVEASQMAAYQCLIGDAIDNIPQVIHPSKAKKLIKAYGTIKSALASQEYREELLPCVEKLKLNAKLVTLRKDVELPELLTLRIQRKELDDDLRRFLPKSYFILLDQASPRTRGLFARR